MTLQALAELGYEQVKLGAVLSREERRNLVTAAADKERVAYSFVGSELSRARGGPRCLTMPLIRGNAPLAWICPRSPAVLWCPTRRDLHGNHHKAKPPSFIGQIGFKTLEGWRFASQVATYCAYATYRLGPGIFKMRRVSFDVFVRQTLFTGVDALPFTAFIALLVGGSLVLSAAIGLGTADGGPLGTILAIALVRELAPLITGLIIIGRSGTAVVVELGNMRVSGEIDTLESMGIDVFEYLVIPRMGAFALSTFCNAVLFHRSCPYRRGPRRSIHSGTG